MKGRKRCTSQGPHSSDRSGTVAGVILQGARATSEVLEDHRLAAFDASWQELDDQMTARLSGRAAREENGT